MKIKTNQTESFLRNLPSSVTAVLLYGPDDGLVRERSVELLSRVVEDPSDPFRVSELTGAGVADDPARLADEAAAISFSGGRRVVRVREAGDAVTTPFEGLLGDSPVDTLVIAEAGDLSPRSSLRKLFESSEQGAAVACYRDDGRSLADLIRHTLAHAGLSVRPDAMKFLIDNLGGDRQISRRELEKLILFKADDPTEVTLEDVACCVGNSSALAQIDIAFAVGLGDLQKLTSSLPRVLQEGTAPVSLLRAVAAHFQRLHLVSGHVNAGQSTENAIKRLKPPLFWKNRDPFLAQVRLWSERDLGRALALLLDAERLTKKTGAPADVILGDVLLKLALRAARRKSRTRA